MRLEAQRVPLEPGAHPAPAQTVEHPVHAVGHPAVRGGQDQAERGGDEDGRGREEEPGEARLPDGGGGVRVEDRPGEERGEGEEEAVGDDDEELPPDRGHDARLEGDAAAPLQEVRLHGLGHHRARGEAQHQGVHDDPHREEPPEAGAARPGGRRRSTSPSSRPGRRRGWAGGAGAGASRATGRGRGPGPRPRTGAPRRAGPGRAARGRTVEAWRSSRFIVGRRSVRASVAPPASGIARRARPRIHSAAPEARDPGPVRHVRLGVPLGARGARRRLRGGGVLRGPGRGGGARLPGDARRVPRPRSAGSLPSRRRGSSPCLLPCSPSAATASSSRLAAARAATPAQAVESFIVFFQALVPTLGRGVRARGQGHLLPPGAHPRPDGVGGPRRRGRPAPREPRLPGPARDHPARGLERPAGAGRERGPLQEPRPARDPDRRRRVRPCPRRGGGAAPRDPAQEPGGPLPLPPHGGRGGAPAVPQGAAGPRHPQHPDPGGRGGARRLRPPARVRRGGAGRRPSRLPAGAAAGHPDPQRHRGAPVSRRRERRAAPAARRSRERAVRRRSRPLPDRPALRAGLVSPVLNRRKRGRRRGSRGWRRHHHLGRRLDDAAVRGDHHGERPAGDELDEGDELGQEGRQEGPVPADEGDEGEARGHVDRVVERGQRGGEQRPLCQIDEKREAAGDPRLAGGQGSGHAASGYQKRGLSATPGRRRPRANLAAQRRGRREMNHLKRAGLVVALIVAAGSAQAQLGMFSSEQRVAITSEWAGERFPDGRPKVADGLLERMKEVTAEEAWGVLTEAGYKSQFEGGWKEINAGAPGRRLVGRVVTAVFMPLRPDLNGAINKAAAAEARVAKGTELLGDRHPPARRRPGGGPLRQDRERDLHRGQPRHLHLRQDEEGRRGPRLRAGPLRHPRDRGLPRLRARLPPDRDRRHDPRRDQRAHPHRGGHRPARRRGPERPRGADLHPAAPRREGRGELRGRALPGRLGPRDAAAGEVHPGAGRLEVDGRDGGRVPRPGRRRGGRGPPGPGHPARRRRLGGDARAADAAAALDRVRVEGGGDEDRAARAEGCRLPPGEEAGRPGEAEEDLDAAPGAGRERARGLDVEQRELELPRGRAVDALARPGLGRLQHLGRPAPRRRASRAAPGRPRAWR